MNFGLELKRKEVFIRGSRRKVESSLNRSILGKSTNDKNIGEIMQQADIDGALIGGAALKVESYSAMVRTTAALYA